MTRPRSPRDGQRWGQDPEISPRPPRSCLQDQDGTQPSRGAPPSKFLCLKREKNEAGGGRGNVRDKGGALGWQELSVVGC